MSREAAKEAPFTPRRRLRIMIRERGRTTDGCESAPAEEACRVAGNLIGEIIGRQLAAYGSVF
jgi:hypothetical protein